MNRLLGKPQSLEMESLLFAERVLVPEPTEVSKRAIQRAKDALSSRQATEYVPNRRRSSGLQRLRVFTAVAAGLMLVALGAAAFRPGYRGSVSAITLTTTKRAAEPNVPPPPPQTTRPADPPPTHAVAPAPAWHSPKARNTTTPRSATDSETYAIELQLLQPAQQAVARRDFESALTVIAEHQRRFASGQLVEEREALRVKALLGLGRATEAQHAGLAFREHFPRSVLLQPIEEMLEALP